MTKEELITKQQLELEEYEKQNYVRKRKLE